MEYEGNQDPDDNSRHPTTKPPLGEPEETKGKITRKGMSLCLLKFIEPMDLRVATEDLEILRDAAAMKCPAVCVWPDRTQKRFRLVDCDGLEVVAPALQPVKLGDGPVVCPINYLIAHGREDGFHNFKPPELVDFIVSLLPKVGSKDSIFVVKLAACETGRKFAWEVVCGAQKQGVNLILLASPLFLYNIPVLDKAEFATQKLDADVETRKINFDNTLTTPEEYDQCMGYAIAQAYLNVVAKLLKAKRSKSGKTFADARAEKAFYDLLGAIECLPKLGGPADLVVDKGPTAVHGVNLLCDSFAGKLRSAIIDYAGKAFQTGKERGETDKARGVGTWPKSAVKLEQALLEWFKGTTLFPEGTEPTLSAIALLVEQRLLAEQELRQKKRAAAQPPKASKKESDAPGPDNTKGPDPSDAPSTSSEVPEVPIDGRDLWSFYLDFLDILRKAAEAAQSEFLMLLRGLLVSKVKGTLREKLLGEALEPGQPGRGSTVLLDGAIGKDVVGTICGVTKGGYLIFSSIAVPSPELLQLISTLSTAPK